MLAVQSRICVSPLYAPIPSECGVPDVTWGDLGTVALVVGALAFAVMIVLAGQKRSEENDGR